MASELALVHPKLRDSATNLVHYTALRQADMRDLQGQLAALGLSSLGRAERHTRSTVQTVIKTLTALYSDQDCDLRNERRDIARSKEFLSDHTRDLLGDKPNGRSVRIMVTLSSEAATSYEFVSLLIDAGMDIARINTVHDDRATWVGIVENINRANAAKNRSCKIVMDLAGPKIRTGQLKPGPQVLRVRPRRDPLGRVIAPRRLRLTNVDSDMPVSGESSLPVTGACMAYAQIGDTLAFRDTRGKKRKLIVVEKDHDVLIAEIFRTAYIATGTKLKLKRKKSGEKLSGTIGALPRIEQPLLLRAGDHLILHRSNDPGEPCVVDSKGRVTQPAHIACTPPEVLRYLSPGDPVRLNDGKIEGIVLFVADDTLGVEITRAKATGSRLRGGKGINFPNSNILLTGPTDADKENLRFVARYADALGLSFVKDPDDVCALQNKLDTFSTTRPGIILKIETERAFHNLPRLLLAAMRSYPMGVMIARGDLAMECGWERLAEIQEEILWMCEAARVPVIWATQV